MVQLPPSRLAFTGWNCIFAVLALRHRAVSSEVLLAALPGWVRDKAKPLGQVLAELGLLPGGARQELERRVREHLKAHQNDPQKSLSALGLPALARAALLLVDDAEWRTCLGWVGAEAAPEAAFADPQTAALLSAPAAVPAPRVKPRSEPDVTAEEALVPEAPAQHEPPRSRYLMLHFHARGGLGDVFVAQDQELHREVALKEIQQPYAHDARARDRFLLEAEVTGRLEHPGVVPVYGMGAHADGRLYYAMRFVRGETLKEAIARLHPAPGSPRDEGARRLLLRQLLGRFVAVCNTIAYAHSRGILHRDIKPANVMLGPYGETLVLDWGLAKPFDRGDEARVGDEITLTPEAADGAALTQLGRIVGTPGYMSPEQGSGLWNLIGPAADVYSLGATLYHLLAGRPSIRGEGLPMAELLTRIQAGKFDPPRRHNKDLPPALEAICLKAMAKEPALRYATALDLATDVERWLADDPVSAHRDPLLERAGRWVRRHPTPVAAVITAIVLGTAGWLTLSWLSSQELEAARQGAEKHVAAALEHRKQGNYDEAVAEYRSAVGLCKDRAGLADIELRASNQLAEVETSRSEQGKATRRRQAEERAAAGLLEARHGDLEKGVTMLRQAAGLLQIDPDMKPQSDRLTQQAHQLERYRFFRQLSDAIQDARSGVFDEDEGPKERLTGAPLAARAREALDVYRVLENKEWTEQLRGGALSNEQAQEVRDRVLDLLTVWALHTLRNTPGGDKGRVSMNLVVQDVARALGLTERSATYWRLHAYVHTRLGEGVLADQAKARATQIEKEPGEKGQEERRSAEKFFAGQMRLYLHSDPVGAMADYRDAARTDPRNFNAHFALFLHGNDSDLQARLGHLTACLALQSRSPLLYYFRGVTHMQMKQPEVAFLDFDAAVRHGSKFALGYFYRGRMFLYQKRNADAEKDITESTNINPGLVMAYPWRAIARAKVGRWADAVKDAEVAVENSPKDALTLFYSARAYAQAVAAVRNDPKAADGDKRADDFTRRSVELLARAAENGFTDVGTRLDPGSDFDPVRSNKDFQALYKKLRKR